MIVLALDTALAACSAAVTDGDRVLAARSEPMMRGHQERLAPLVAEVMAEAGLAFDRLDRIGVTVGPGSFTGLRVGLAFAKGLSVALQIPCAGFSTLEALAASPFPMADGGRAGDGGDLSGERGARTPTPYPSPIEGEGRNFVAAVIDARRDQLYVQAFTRGRPLMAPDALAPEIAAARLAELYAGGLALLVGPGAHLLEGIIPGARLDAREAADPVVLARLAAAAPKPAHRPRPLYLRGADARTIAERAALSGEVAAGSPSESAAKSKSAAAS